MAQLGRGRTRQRFWWIAVATAISSACGTTPVDPDSGSVTTTQEPAESIAARPTSETVSSVPDPSEPPSLNEAAARVVRQKRRHFYPDPLGDLQNQFGVAPLMLPLGEVTTDDLGIEMTLTLDNWWRLERAGPAEIVMAPPENPIGRLRPILIFTRPIGYFDPIVAGYGDNIPGDETLPPHGLRQWLDGLDQVVVNNTESFYLDDRLVTRYDVDLDPTLGPTSDGCSPGDCVDFLWNGASDHFVLRDKETVRYYEIADPQGPIVVIVAANDGDADFLYRSDRLIRSLRLGSSAPHPIPADSRWSNFSVVDPGEWGLALPGIKLAISEYSYISQRAGIVETGHPVVDNGSREITRPLTDGAGVELRTVDDLRASLAADTDWGLTEGDQIDWRDADGVERTGTSFSVTTPFLEHDESPPVLLAPTKPGDDLRLPAWPAHRDGTYIATEVDSLGLLILGTHAFGTEPLSDDALADVIELAQSLRFLQ